ncbi:MAG: TetR/AcrR family transcriptional regulator, partial [Bacteriovoracaceae bacterium]|nr:TetR/AcrR family transcriptional regulator [Bacteriovoracaceae bacterium]
MGKKRQFNEDEVLDQLATHFWKHGYSATKVDQLSDVTGLTKTSLYNAFGNKESLFLNSINFYVERSLEKLVGAMDRGQSLSVNLDGLLRATFLDCDKDVLSYGCLLTNSIVELNANEPTLHEAASGLCDKVRDVKHELFSYYVDAGRLSADYSASELTDLYMTLWQGLRVQSRNSSAESKIKNS